MYSISAQIDSNTDVFNYMKSLCGGYRWGYNGGVSSYQELFSGTLVNFNTNPFRFINDFYDIHEYYKELDWVINGSDLSRDVIDMGHRNFCEDFFCLNSDLIKVNSDETGCSSVKYDDLKIPIFKKKTEKIQRFIFNASHLVIIRDNLVNVIDPNIGCLRLSYDASQGIDRCMPTGDVCVTKYGDIWNMSFKYTMGNNVE